MFNSQYLIWGSELAEKLKGLVANYEIYRVKGFVAVPNKSMGLVLQGVGDHFDYFYDRLWQKDEIRETKLVLIGKFLQREKIQLELSNNFSN